MAVRLVFLFTQPPFSACVLALQRVHRIRSDTMKIYLSGACKNGKSFRAQRLAKDMQKPGRPLYYLATMIPADEEDRLRIETHRRERHGWGFETLEITSNVAEATAPCDPEAPLLLDSVTALLANRMFDRNGDMDRDAPEKTIEDLLALAGKTKNIVFVSDYIYSDACLYDEPTEAFRHGLARIDRTVAAACDTVLEVVAGNTVTYYPNKTGDGRSGAGGRK